VSAAVWAGPLAGTVRLDSVLVEAVDTVEDPPFDPRRRHFNRPKRFDPHNENFNWILDKRFRVTPLRPWQWNEGIKRWVGFGELWNRHSKTWGEMRLFHCREFECENNSMSTI
jgi:hypothetical protein